MNNNAFQGKIKTITFKKQYLLALYTTQAIFV